MGLFRVNATREGVLRLAEPIGDWRAALGEALARLPASAPVCVLIHGFRFTWRQEIGAGCFCPHRRLYRETGVAPSRRRRPPLAAWPAALGFVEGDPAAGLSICLGWDARPRRAALSIRAVSDFAEVYERAAVAGEALATLSHAIAEARPGRPVDILAHSLGARVALSAAEARPNLPFGRLIFLGAAEYRGVAAAAVTALDRAGSQAKIYHLLSRANDPFDALFEAFAPRPERPGDRPLGVAGLGRVNRRWLDIQLDHPALGPWLEARGFALERSHERVSHWHFYTDPGAMALYRAILRRRPGLSVKALRAAGLPFGIEPRWSRLTPRLPGLGSLRPAAPAQPVAEITES